LGHGDHYRGDYDSLAGQIFGQCIQRQIVDAGRTMPTQLATGIYDLNISGIFRNIAKAWVKFAEVIEQNDLDDTYANEVRNHIETAEERVLGARLAIAEAKELIANADKLLSRR
jgi:hypothetical protein